MSDTENTKETNEEQEPLPVEGKKKKNYRKDKPWDTDDIDHWKLEVPPLFQHILFF